MDNTVFAQSVARIRFLETKLLDSSKIQSLAESRDFDDCIRMLQDSAYSIYLNSFSYEDGLKKALQDFYADMYKTSPVREIVDIFAARYDAHNIKSLIKCRLVHADASALLIDNGSIPVDKLKSMFDEENFRDMPQTLRTYTEKALESHGDANDPQSIDMAVDRGLYLYMMELAEKSGLEYLVNLVKLFIDVVNIKTFIRVKLQDRGREFLQQAYIPGGKLDFDLFGNNINDSLESFPGRMFHTDHYKWLKAGIDEYIKSQNLGEVERYGDNYLVGCM